jgi:RNA polymerase sigma-70 factor, ECF subfamily
VLRYVDETRAAPRLPRAASVVSPRLDRDAADVRKARAGDLRAFESLVERHRDIALRVAARIVGEDDAADVAQDAFLRAFHRLSRFRGDAPFRSWLLRIVHNSALDTLARRRDEVLVEPTLDAVPTRPLGSPPARQPAQQLEEGERRDRLHSKLRLLTPPHRAVLILRDLEGLTYDEIADVTESPLGSVKGRLHRARRELVDILRANTYDWELPDEH